MVVVVVVLGRGGGTIIQLLMERRIWSGIIKTNGRGGGVREGVCACLCLRIALCKCVCAHVLMGMRVHCKKKSPYVIFGL